MVAVTLTHTGMNKIKVKNPLVEIDGDEMARVLWQTVKDQLILPYFDVKLEYFDLDIKNRDNLSDKITIQAAEAINRRGVGVKCATLTPDADRVRDLKLKREWASPDATMRSILDGTMLRRPIVISCVEPLICSWKKPITLARHAYGDLYMGSEIDCWGPGKVELVYSAANGMVDKQLITEMHGPGVVQGVHNSDSSIRNFARTCFHWALSEKTDLWFGNKGSISRTYHGRFTEIFKEEYETFKSDFDAAGLKFVSGQIDDIVVRIMRHEGGVLWACMNYDGDVFSDVLAAGFGSHTLMSSMLVSHNGNYLFESAHGTISRHYQRYLDGEPISTNPIATIYAWTGALAQRGRLDETPDVEQRAKAIEAAVHEAVADGIMTGDLAKLCGVTGPEPPCTTEQFVNSVAERLEEKLPKC